jgi:hypothetical protein
MASRKWEGLRSCTSPPSPLRRSGFPPICRTTRCPWVHLSRALENTEPWSPLGAAVLGWNLVDHQAAGGSGGRRSKESGAPAGRKMRACGPHAVPGWPQDLRPNASAKRAVSATQDYNRGESTMSFDKLPKLTFWRAVLLVILSRRLLFRVLASLHQRLWEVATHLTRPFPLGTCGLALTWSVEWGWRRVGSRSRPPFTSSISAATTPSCVPRNSHGLPGLRAGGGGAAV